MTAVHTGPEVLARYLASNQVDVHALDLEGFRTWLAARILEQEHNEVFRQKCRIRDLVRQHRRRLQHRAKVAEEAWDAYVRSAHYRELEQLARQIIRLRKGVTGLALAVHEGRADPQKLAEFEQALEQRQRTYAELVESSPEKQRLGRAEASLARLRNEIGLTRDEARLQTLQRHRGRRSGAAGSRFEDTARTVINRGIVPALHSSGGETVCLSGVTLGCARAEFDTLIVGVAPERNVVDVLAVVEAKRNLNDIVAGFNMRQENLAWFIGDSSGYDPQQYRTGYFSTGHFDRQAVHLQEDRTFTFDRTSFRHFHRDSETRHFLARLWFVTEMRPLAGVTTLELARMLHRVATDPDFDLTSDTSLGRFRQRTLPFVERFQTRDVLDVYHRRPFAEQIVFCGR